MDTSCRRPFLGTTQTSKMSSQSFPPIFISNFESDKLKDISLGPKDTFVRSETAAIVDTGMEATSSLSDLEENLMIGSANVELGEEQVFSDESIERGDKKLSVANVFAPSCEVLNERPKTSSFGEQRPRTAQSVLPTEPIDHPRPMTAAGQPNPIQILRRTESTPTDVSVSPTRLAGGGGGGLPVVSTGLRFQRLNSPGLNKIGISSARGTSTPPIFAKRRPAVEKSLKDQNLTTSGSLITCLHPEAIAKDSDSFREALDMTKAMSDLSKKNGKLDRTWSLLSQPGYYEAVGSDQFYKSVSHSSLVSAHEFTDFFDSATRDRDRNSKRNAIQRSDTSCWSETVIKSGVKLFLPGGSMRHK